jgi:methylphosphotriester-DNA--protein-cysteine methyltransferase
MIRHTDLGKEAVRMKIRLGTIRCAGNRRLKIYGTLRCSSGKRVKQANRVFFASIAEARSSGFRPCGHCLKNEYKTWKNETV